MGALDVCLTNRFDATDPPSSESEVCNARLDADPNMIYKKMTTVLVWLA